MNVKITNHTVFRNKIVYKGEVHDVNDHEFKILSNNNKAVLISEEEKQMAIKENIDTRESELAVKRTTRKK